VPQVRKLAASEPLADNGQTGIMAENQVQVQQTKWRVAGQLALWRSHFYRILPIKLAKAS
jgi:hypothetical protein